MADGDVIGIRIVGRFQGQNIVSTMHYEITHQTITDHQILQIFSDAWSAKFSAAWLLRHIDSYELIGLKAFSLTGGNKVPGRTIVETAGGVIGVETPSPLCRVITLYTDSDNHWRRGRVQLSGSADDMFNDADGAVSEAEITALGTLADLLIDGVESDEETFAPCLPAGTGVGGPYLLEPITAALVRRTPACIRSRRVKGFAIG